MKLNPLVDILLNYDKMSITKKLQRSQEIEDMVARFQGRKPRIVTNKLNNELMNIIRETGRKPDAFYSRNDNKKIYIVDMSSNIDLIKSIIHEGWHAYVDDFLNGKAMLKTFSKFDRKEFLFAEENLPSIFEQIEKYNLFHLYDSFFPEERINYLEDSLYMIKYIIDAIETPKDALKLESFVLLSMLYYVENESRGKNFEKEYSVKYEDIVNCIKLQKQKTTIDVSKAGRSKDLIDEELLNFFNKMLVPYSSFYNTEHNKLLPPDVKTRLINQKINEMRQIYCEFISGKLKKKSFT